MCLNLYLVIVNMLFINIISNVIYSNNRQRWQRQLIFNNNNSNLIFFTKKKHPDYSVHKTNSGKINQFLHNL